jgi:ATP-dependent DNA helicase RecG
MNIKQLKSLIAQGESETLEFKASTAQLKPACETLCGYLNARGGVVLIGVRNSGEIIGQDVTDNTRQEIANELRKFEPTAQITVDHIKVGDRQVIMMQAPVGKHAPYVYDGRPFERTQNSKGRMTQHHYEQLLVERGQLNHAWDEQPAIGYDIDSLNHEEIRNTIRDGVNENRIAVEVLNYSIEQMLRYMELFSNGKLINAAVVLYAKKVEPNYSQCLMRMTRYRGLDKLSNFMDSKHVYGNAFNILSEANYFTMRHLPVASFFESDKFERIDKPALPVMAVREALINAISHRDYADHSASMSFAIFDDRLEIWSNGTLSSKLKISDLKKQHESFPRNKRIAKIFYSRGWVEKAGIGTLRMIDDCKKLGVPEPTFEEYSSGFAVIFGFKEVMGTKSSSKTDKKALSARQEAILALVKQHGAIGIQKIMSELLEPPSQRMVRKDLNYLKDIGVLELKGSARAALWQIK